MSGSKAGAARARGGKGRGNAGASPAPAARGAASRSREAAAAAREASEAAAAREAAADAGPREGEYVVSLPTFEGPLDLLLHLIQQHELDILDIPVSFVTEKYLEYLRIMRSLTIDLASEYLVMAATLAHIKSKMLLPSVPAGQDDDGMPGEEEDPRAELVRRLLEYQKYKVAAADLAERGTLGRDVFTRGMSESEVPKGPAPFASTSIFGLLDAFERVLKRTNVQIDHEVVFDRISITDRIVELTEKLSARRAMRFEDLLLDSVSKGGVIPRFEVVITFLAVLEMCKLRLIRVHQTDPLAPIHIQLAVADGAPVPEFEPDDGAPAEQQSAPAEQESAPAESDAAGAPPAGEPAGPEATAAEAAETAGGEPAGPAVEVTEAAESGEPAEPEAVETAEAEAERSEAAEPEAVETAEAEVERSEAVEPEAVGPEAVETAEAEVERSEAVEPEAVETAEAEEEVERSEVAEPEAVETAEAEEVERSEAAEPEAVETAEAEEVERSEAAEPEAVETAEAEEVERSEAVEPEAVETAEAEAERSEAVEPEAVETAEAEAERSEAVEIEAIETAEAEAEADAGSRAPMEPELAGPAEDPGGEPLRPELTEAAEETGDAHDVAVDEPASEADAGAALEETSRDAVAERSDLPTPEDVAAPSAAVDEVDAGSGRDGG
ncbi:segregation and condensation protein A [Sorangium sp. So ce1097]|uniref:segregation and condensation protein A n=1 Tax=Sorangium sp. So ce1097 TaxID=3133330 RepID=UPI003F636662